MSFAAFLVIAVLTLSLPSLLLSAVMLVSHGLRQRDENRKEVAASAEAIAATIDAQLRYWTGELQARGQLSYRQVVMTPGSMPLCVTACPTSPPGTRYP